MRRTIGRKPGYRRKSPRKRLFGQMMRKRIFRSGQSCSSRMTRRRPPGSSQRGLMGEKADADSRKELETGRLEQTAPEEEAKKEAPMEPAADACDGWEESEGSEEKADEASADSKPQEAVGQEDHGQGEAPEASGPEAGGQEQRD